MKKQISVAAGILLRSDGSFLLASRPASKLWAGYWEFPGGKVETDESVYAALVRELHEELGIHVTQALPWLTRTHHSHQLTIRLFFYRVLAWDGEPRSREGQNLTWQYGNTLNVTPILPANSAIIKSLSLPLVHAITCCSELGVSVVLDALYSDSSIRMVQIREPNMSTEALRIFTEEVASVVHARGGIVVLNGESALEQALLLGDGIHLTAKQLYALEARPDLRWVGASVHNAADLMLATRWELDYALMGHIKHTLSHADKLPMGWEGFEYQLASGAPLPVYALGGMSTNDIERAWRAGGHGVALMRGAWQ